MAQMSEKISYTVLITGFGPFDNFPVNYSWETVKCLWELEWPSNIKLITRELPVIYDTVSKEVPKLWQQLKPDLVIHCGVSGIAKQIQIEKQSFNNTYNKEDISKCLPPNECCKLNGETIIQTGLDVEELCKYANSNCEKLNTTCKCEASFDPGNYLCGFIYYTSLCEDRKKCLFVHVPPEKIYKPKEMSVALQSIVFNALKQLYNYS